MTDRDDNEHGAEGALSNDGQGSDDAQGDPASVPQHSAQPPVTNDDLCSVARALGFDPQPVRLIVAPGVRGFPGESTATDATDAEYEIRGEARRQIDPTKLGCVFDAIACADGREVVVCSGMNRRSRGMPLFLATVLRRLQHVNIPRLQLMGMTSDRTLLYATDRWHGSFWGDSIRSRTLPENLNVLMAVANAFAFANSHGVLQTNVTPDTVFVEDDGRVLLTHWTYVILTDAFPEFALCDQYQNQLLYAHGAVGFTPAYVAPEIVNHDIARVTERTLVYQCGAILFEILTGKPPHTGKNAMNCAQNAAKNIIVPVEQSGELMSIAQRALQTHPEDRFSTVQDFQAAVEGHGKNGASH
jgi:hypothetical protein